MAAEEASYEDAEALAKQWSASVLQCRTLGHAWRQTNATLVQSLNYWRVSYGCIRGCGVTRYEEWNSRGVVIGRSTLSYPKDENGEPLYLATGVGRITSEGKGALRIANATRGPNDRTPRRAAREDDLPRKRASREALGIIEGQEG